MATSATPSAEKNNLTGENDAAKVLIHACLRASQHREVIEATLECKYGLLDVLFASDFLSHKQLELFENKSGIYETNNVLLKIIKNEKCISKLNNFMAALKVTGQRHVEKYISSSGNLDLSDKDRPLTYQERKRFQSMHLYLVNEITLNGLLDNLISVDCIHEKHKESVEIQKSISEQIRELLNIIQRRSFAEVQLFNECLRRTEQKHCCIDLEIDQVVTSLNAYLDVPSRKRRKEMEETIVTTYRLTVNEKDYRSIFGIPGIELISVEPGCIKLYILCTTLKRLQTLRRQLEDNRLKSSVEKLFNSLLIDSSFNLLTSLHSRSNVEYNQIRLSHFCLVNYCQAEDSFNARHEHDSSLLIIGPRSLQEVQLKAISIMNKNQYSTRPSCLKWEYVLLSSVCSTWRQILQQTSFKKRMCLYLKGAQRSESLADKDTSAKLNEAIDVRVVGLSEKPILISKVYLVDQVYDKVIEICGFSSVDGVQLIHAGRILQYGCQKFLHDYFICNQSTIYGVLRISGGGVSP